MANIYWWSMGWSRKDETKDLDSVVTPSLCRMAKIH